MSARKKLVIVTALLVVGMALALLGDRRNCEMERGIGVAMDLGGILLMAVLYRCSRCGRYLGGNFQIGRHCPRCGEKIE